MRCPVCRAENTEGPQCRRCKADLTLLWTLENQRTVALSRARQAIAAGETGQALHQARTAHELRRGPDSYKALALAHLAYGDFATALEYHDLTIAGGESD